MPITNETALQIHDMLDQRLSVQPDDHLFLSSRINSRTGQYGPLSKRSIQDNINKYLKLNCMDNKTNFGPHLLRHTGATLMVKNGTDVVTLQQILGHQNVNTTMIYTHTNFEDMKSAVKSFR